MNWIFFGDREKATISIWVIRYLELEKSEWRVISWQNTELHTKCTRLQRKLIGRKEIGAN